MSVIPNISSAIRNRSTYRAGLLQARAFRFLKARTDEVLVPFGITSVHWALLGLLFEKKSMRMSDLANELGVEAPFITMLINNLSKLRLVETEQDPEDSRAKCAKLTKAGLKFVPATEAQVRSAMRPVVHGISIGELMTYLKVLETIIANDEP